MFLAFSLLRSFRLEALRLLFDYVGYLVLLHFEPLSVSSYSGLGVKVLRRISANGASDCARFYLYGFT